MDRNFWAVSFNDDGTIHTADECGPWRIAAWVFGNRHLNRTRWAVLTEAEYRRLEDEENASMWCPIDECRYFGIRPAVN